MGTDSNGAGSAGWCLPQNSELCFLAPQPPAPHSGSSRYSHLFGAIQTGQNAGRRPVLKPVLRYFCASFGKGESGRVFEKGKVVYFLWYEACAGERLPPLPPLPAALVPLSPMKVKPVG
ncbi:hypothetical protein B5X24_HaOG205305 [Helicoverpa armigera]|uniref:Uncharacterized protein n=1 Tax=Helicoverpa armigera TaxID=29058 RepID=A0A2W1BLF3_HELAM|nr:hypothetical protein B5X24_HaOG205305 [Helicoverpa armigera]